MCKEDDIFRRQDIRLMYVCFVAVVYYFFCCSFCFGAVLDRVVASVDETAITLSELEENHVKMRETLKDITEMEVVTSMINQLLLVKEAKKMRLDADSKEQLLRDYIDIRIKSSILIKEEEIELFFRENIENFKGKTYITVRDDIERYLTERETNKRLKEHLDELRAGADIKIQITNQ